MDHPVVKVGDEVGVQVGVQVPYRWVRVGGWSDKAKLMLNSEIGKNKTKSTKQNILKQLGCDL